MQNTLFRTRVRLAACALFCLISSACTAISFTSQDIAFDFDHEADSLTVSIGYNDIGAVRAAGGWLRAPTGKPDLDKSEGFLRWITEGGRGFILFWPFEELLLPPRRLDVVGTPAEVRYLSRIQMLEASVNVGQGGQLDAKQRFLVPNVRAGLTLANAAIVTALGDIDKEIAHLKKRDNLRFEDVVSLGSLEIVKADIAAGFQWIKLGERGLELCYPVRSEHLIPLLALGLREAAASDGGEDLPQGMRLLASALPMARDIRIGDDHVTLFLGSLEGDFAIKVDVGQFAEFKHDSRLALREHIANSDFELPATWVFSE